MVKLSEIDLGSVLLSTFILFGFIATAFVFIRLTIIGINYVKVNYLKEEEEGEVNSVNKKQKNLEMINNTIDSTQSAYEKIIEISHVLLTVIKKDKRNIKEN